MSSAPARAPRRAPAGGWPQTGSAADPQVTAPPKAAETPLDSALAPEAPAQAPVEETSAPAPAPRALPPATGNGPRPAPRTSAPRTSASANSATPVARSLLPTAKTPPRSSLSDYTILLYGAPKVGKSTLAAQFDDAVFLATEPGLNALEVYQVPVSSWQTFIDACKELSEGQHPFKTVVVDTVDNLFKFCSEAVMRKAGVQHESDLEWGKGWALVRDEFLRVLNRLALLPYGLILISHAEFSNIKTPTKQIVKAVPTMPKQAREIVMPIADFILYAEVLDTPDGQERVLRCQAAEQWDAGARLDGFPNTIEMSYPAFRSAFDRTLIEILTPSGGAA